MAVKLPRHNPETLSVRLTHIIIVLLAVASLSASAVVSANHRGSIIASAVHGVSLTTGTRAMRPIMMTPGPVLRARLRVG
jgi:hypothetical protein